MNPDERSVLAGFFWGAAIGAGIALFRAPRLKLNPARQLQDVRQEVREKLEAVIPADSIMEGIAEGKAAARRRLAELGVHRDPAVPDFR